MHAAPPVRMSIGADPGSRAFVMACAAMAAANLTAWFADLYGQPGAMVAAAALLAATVSVPISLYILRSRFVSGVLAWDGATWQWLADPMRALDTDPVAGDTRIMIDLGPWMLLRFEPEGSRRQNPRWLPVSRRQAGPAWPDWRAALHARRVLDRRAKDLAS